MSTAGGAGTLYAASYHQEAQRGKGIGAKVFLFERGSSLSDFSKKNALEGSREMDFLRRSTEALPVLLLSLVACVSAQVND